jgi:hypothetical protein
MKFQDFLEIVGELPFFETGLLLTGGSEETWRGIVMKKLQDANWKNIKADLYPFIKTGDQISDALCRDNFEQLLVK